MTEEEYDALDERLTNTVPTLGHTGTGFFSRKSSQVVEETIENLFKDYPGEIFKTEITNPVEPVGEEKW